MKKLKKIVAFIERLFRKKYKKDNQITIDVNCNARQATKALQKMKVDVDRLAESMENLGVISKDTGYSIGCLNDELNKLNENGKKVKNSKNGVHKPRYGKHQS